MNLSRFPSSICVVGAGVIGCEYATIFATMGIKTYLVNSNSKILPFVDNSVSDALLEEMKKLDIDILFDASLDNIDRPKSEQDELKIKLSTGQIVKSDMFLFAAGRSGAISGLGLENIGIKLGKRETIAVNEKYQTSIPNIYAVGDVIGFPALASTSMDQGRVAIAHMYGLTDIEHISDIVPYGIYTIPEVSMVGMTSEDAEKDSEEYLSGKALIKNLPRGQIMGANYGFLKIVFRKKDRVIVGAHMLGPLATEIIHYGMLLVKNEVTINEVIGTAFNFPTLHDIYKYACYDALGNLAGYKVKDF